MKADRTDIKILGTESLGVRGLCCSVKTRDRHILFDPGVALGYTRGGLLPHPAQISVGEQVRENIIDVFQEATDVVISHFHGDHMPLPHANPYQLQASRIAHYLRSTRLWTKTLDQESPRLRERAERFLDMVPGNLQQVDGQAHGPFSFSEPVPHGEKNNGLGTVMMTRLESEGEVFVHASDIQLLDPQAVDQIVRWEPTTVLVSGPPLYRKLSHRQKKIAWCSGLKLVRNVHTSIIDHHLLRCQEGVKWLQRLDSQTDNNVLCAADYMQKQRRLLEARRPELYEQAPVPPGWHKGYAEGHRDASEFECP